MASPDPVADPALQLSRASGRPLPAEAAAAGVGGLLRQEGVAARRDCDAALAALSSLITRRKRADGSNWGDAFSLMHTYVQILELEEPVAALSVIHVAGTKGKGSTCAFAESILRAAGRRTGLFTSPHLIDVRERFRFDGEEVEEDLFLQHFWWCFDRLQSHATESVPMPAYFRFLTLLALRLFTAEKVDVALLEVGIGGRFDATNVVAAPAVCGVSSLGYDHQELLGDTLAEIAGEKAGIFKPGVPAITCQQPEEAMAVLQARAAELKIPLLVAPPLEGVLAGLRLGLAGDHQRINAALAVALCCEWARRSGRGGEASAVEEAIRAGTLPEPYVRGLVSARWPGRAQILSDPFLDDDADAPPAGGAARGRHEPRDGFAAGRSGSFARVCPRPAEREATGVGDGLAASRGGCAEALPALTWPPPPPAV